MTKNGQKQSFGCSLNEPRNHWSRVGFINLRVSLPAGLLQVFYKPVEGIEQGLEPLRTAFQLAQGVAGRL